MSTRINSTLENVFKKVAFSLDMCRREATHGHETALLSGTMSARLQKINSWWLLICISKNDYSSYCLLPPSK